MIAINYGEQIGKWNFDNEDWSNAFLLQMT
jgi:hypothetical protein